MRNVQEYRLWLTITISHEYFTQTHCPVILDPLPETQFIFKKCNIMFIRQHTTRWDLFIEEKFNPEDLLMKEYKVIFGLVPQNRKFYYLSLNPTTKHDTFCSHSAPASKTWRNIDLNLPYIINNNLQNIDISVKSPEKHYEYVCIPKYHNSNINLQLRDERNIIELHEKEFYPVADIRNARRFMSKERVKLSEDNDPKIQLVEIRDSGERVISNSIPNPQPDEFSLIDPEGTITTYFYF